MRFGCDDFLCSRSRGDKLWGIGWNRFETTSRDNFFKLGLHTRVGRDDFLCSWSRGDKLRGIGWDWFETTSRDNFFTRFKRLLRQILTVYTCDFYRDNLLRLSRRDQFAWKIVRVNPALRGWCDKFLLFTRAIFVATTLRPGRHDRFAWKIARVNPTLNCIK